MRKVPTWGQRGGESVGQLKGITGTADTAGISDITGTAGIANITGTVGMTRTEGIAGTVGITGTAGITGTVGIAGIHLTGLQVLLRLLTRYKAQQCPVEKLIVLLSYTWFYCFVYIMISVLTHRFLNHFDNTYPLVCCFFFSFYYSPHI